MNPRHRRAHSVYSGLPGPRGRHAVADPFERHILSRDVWGQPGPLCIGVVLDQLFRMLVEFVFVPRRLCIRHLHCAELRVNLHRLPRDFVTRSFVVVRHSKPLPYQQCSIKAIRHQGGDRATVDVVDFLCAIRVNVRGDERLVRLGLLYIYRVGTRMDGGELMQGLRKLCWPDVLSWWRALCTIERLPNRPPLGHARG